MEGDEDPTYIINLLNPETEHNCYFVVGDPSQGPVERIGAVPAMLMAHSLVLRRVLSVQETDLLDRWDIPLPYMKPKTFKNMLRFAYGFNNIRTYTLKDTLELLKVAEQLVMKPLLFEIVKHILEMLTPANVCALLQEPICLKVRKLEIGIVEVLKANTMEILKSDNFYMISPENMRYIVHLSTLRTSEAKVFESIIRWARQRVLHEQLPVNVNRLEAYFCPQLILPCLKDIHSCMFNMIQLVEDASSGAEVDLELISKYHYIPDDPRRRVFVCTESSDEKDITHEEFELKVIYNSSFWTDMVVKIRSELIINTADSPLGLYAIVCNGTKIRSKESTRMMTFSKEVGVLPAYECVCTVKISCLLNCGEDEEIRIGTIIFKELVMFDEDFQICLKRDAKLLKLEPNNRYKLETTFSYPHPLWCCDETDHLTRGEDNSFSVKCGLFSDEHNWCGSHIKYVLYRILSD